MAKCKPVTIQHRGYSVKMSGYEGELTMYGEIVESQPVNYWTGEPIEGQFIILKDFLTELEKLSALKSLTIHLNSLGGDAYSSIVIHNRLRELQRNGTKIACNVDGVAMSGGSLIMSACDTVRVNPSSIIMIHDCWTFIFDAFDSGSLRKMADQLDKMDESQAQIYARKSGQSLEAIRSMMDETTMMVGQEAVDYGFADEMFDGGEKLDVDVSADMKFVFVNGQKMRISALTRLSDRVRAEPFFPDLAPDTAEDTEAHEGEPETPENGAEEIESAEGEPECSEDNTPETTGRNEGGIPMTLDELRKSDPEAAEALLAEAQANASQEAVQAERQRIAEIDRIASLFDAETVNAAKYGDNACTAQEMAYRAAMASVEQGRAFMANLHADGEESGADEVEAAPAPEEEAQVPETPEALMAAGKAAALKMLGKNEEV